MNLSESPDKLMFEAARRLGKQSEQTYRNMSDPANAMPLYLAAINANVSGFARHCGINPIRAQQAISYSMGKMHASARSSGDVPTATYLLKRLCAIKNIRLDGAA